MKSIVRAALAVVLTLSSVACDDPLLPGAVGSNSEVTLQVYPLNGSPVGTASALAVFTSTTARVDAGVNFDLAFDLEADGDVVLYPARLVASALANAPRVGLQTVTTPFSSLTRAPNSGYTVDSALVAPIGRTVAIQLPGSQLCFGSFTGTDIYAKLVVDSVAADRRIWLRLLANTTCGYRSLTPGTPED